MLERRFLAPHALAYWAQATPDATALEHVDGPHVSFATLLEESLTFAAALQRVGVGRGDHVGTLVPNIFDAHRTLLGIAWLCGVEVPLRSNLNRFDPANCGTVTGLDTANPRVVEIVQSLF